MDVPQANLAQLNLAQLNLAQANLAQANLAQANLAQANLPQAVAPLAAVCAAVVMWSLSALTIRAGHADTLRFVMWRAWFSLPVLAIIVTIRARRSQTPMFAPAVGVSKLRWAITIVGAGVLFAAAALLGFGAVNRTALLDNAVISSLQPLLIVGVAVAWLGEHANRSHWLRAAIALAGTVLVVTAKASGEHHDALGIAMATGALVLNVAWYSYARWLRSRFDVDPVALMLGVLTTVSVILTPVTLAVRGTVSLPAHALLWSAATMVVGTGAHLCSIWAQRFVPASVSSLFLLAQAPLVGLAAWWAFGERPAVVQVAGTVVVLSALAGVVRSQTIAHMTGSD